MNKIIYLANMRLPTEKAHGIQVMKMCESFALHNANLRMNANATNNANKNKLDVTLVVPRRFNKIKQDPFEYYEVKRIFKIKKLPSLDLIPLGLPRFGYFIQSWSFIKWVFWYLLFKKADFIYCRDFVCLWLFKFMRKKFVFEAHHFPEHFSLYKKNLLRTSAIITITSQLKNKLIQQGIPAEKILVAPDGVDLEKFEVTSPPASPEASRPVLDRVGTRSGGRAKLEVRKKLNLPLDRKIVLYAGHLYAWKGADVLAEASKYLGSNMLVVFVGGTEKDTKIFNFQFSILKNIFVVGHKPHADMPFYLKAADVLVLPNSAREPLSRQWTSPLKMFEYMASGQPIVASDLPSLREVLNSKNAILVKPDSPEALAEGIKAVLDNPDLARQISLQASQDVQQYTWQKRARNILEFIK